MSKDISMITNVKLSMQKTTVSSKQKINYIVDPSIIPLMYGNIKNVLDKYSAADICFICDTTYTMNTCITQIKEMLTNFIKNVVDIISFAPRLAFIQFKDKYPEGTDKKVMHAPVKGSEEVKGEEGSDDQVHIKGFTTNVYEMLQYIESIKCDGGGDRCEDVYTPLKKALNLDWRSDLLYVFLLLDAPTHGKRYHGDEVDDDFPDDDEHSLLEKIICHYRKSKINLVIIKCSKSVDIMIDIIRVNYDSKINKLIVVGLSKDAKEITKEFTKNFTENMTKAFAESYYYNFRCIKCAPEPKTIDENTHLGIYLEFTGQIYSGQVDNLCFDKKLYDYKFSLKHTVEIKCKIASDVKKSNIATGMFKNCYNLLANGTNYVAKISKIPIKKIEDLIPDIEGNIFADHFAICFNNLIKEPLIRVLSVVIMEVLDNQDQKIFNGSKAILAQSLMKGAYTKFNNNYGWVMKQRVGTNEETKSLMKGNLIAQAFSHFTYEYSMGTLIIVDIQGVVNATQDKHLAREYLLITDPAMHSLLYKGHFGETNHGKLGILKFFKTHNCNEYCKKLKLFNYKELKNDKLKDMMAKYAGDTGLKHLYGNFEATIEKWKKNISAFDPDIEPVLAPIEEKHYQESNLAYSKIVTGGYHDSLMN